MPRASDRVSNAASDGTVRGARPFGQLLRVACASLGLWLASMPSGNASMPEQSTAAPRKAFISGHSLTNRPFPEYLENIVRSAGLPFAWNRQYVEGSTIQQRSRGGPGVSGWDGYRRGQDRHDGPIDVLAELRTAGAAEATRYDALIITERNALLAEVMWNDTVRSLRHFHDVFIAANPGGRTFFFEPWMALDKDDPARWIAYEREASQGWACVVGAVNASLAAEGRRDRIVSVPVASALAGLVERVLDSPVPGLKPPGGSTRPLDALFTDDVHPTPAAAYFTALAFFTNVWGRTAVGTWAPDTIDPALAGFLQRAADELAAAGTSKAGMDLAACRSYMGWSFQWTFWPYMNDISLRKDLGYVRSRMVLAKHLAGSIRYFWDNAAPNPFADPQQLTSGYWLPPPP